MMHLMDQLASLVPNEELARLARRCAGGLSTRQLEMRTGVNRSTISRLLRGMAVSAISLSAFAAGMGCDVNELRLAAGMDEIHPRKRETLESFGTMVDASPYLYALCESHIVTADAVGDITSKGHQVRAVRVDGRRFEPYLQDGDVALVIPPDVAQDGDVCLAMLDLNRAVCGVHHLRDGQSYLEVGGDMVPASRYILVGVVRHKVTPLRR